MKPEMLSLAANLLLFASVYDHYEYIDSQPDFHEIAADLAAGRTEGYIAFLTEAMEDSEIEAEQRDAASLIRQLQNL